MERSFASVTRWLFSPESGPTDRVLPRWIFLRGLGLIYFSAFYSLIFQIKGLIGPDGILPATEYLQALAKLGLKRFWYAPTLFWFASGQHMLMAVCWVGLIAAILLVLNIWPRVMLARVLRVLSVVRQCGPGFLGLSVGRNAAGGRVYFAVLRAGGSAAGFGPA